MFTSQRCINTISNWQFILEHGGIVLEAGPLWLIYQANFSIYAAG